MLIQVQDCLHLDRYPRGVYTGYMLKTSQKKLINRLRIIKGQMNGLQGTIEKQGYCPDVIRLSLAIQKSLQSFNQVMLENHLQEHVGHQFEHGDERKAIKELAEIYNLINK